MLFKYLDLPPIPEHLLQADREQFRLRENVFRIPTYEFYKLHYVSQDIDDFLKTIFDFPFYAWYQVITDGLNIHKDGCRTEAINFITDTGGDNATLRLYDEDQTSIVHQERIQPLRWHWIDVSKFHNVVNIDSTRISVSIVKTY